MDAHERTVAIENQRQPADRPEERLWVADQWRPFKVWRVPVPLLVLNVENRRFSAERRYYEAKLGRTLDPENVERDAESLESILLDKPRQVTSDGRVIGRPSKDTRALEEDWVSRQQETPIWIRPDGTVHNGNRRLAVVRRRRRQQGAEGNNWIDAIIIGPDIDDLTLFHMEQHEQLTEDYKVRYTDVNLLLAIRDAAMANNIDWGDPDDIDRVAGLLQGVMRNNKNYAVTQLYAVKYMDDFLADLDQEEAYELLIGQIERFRDVGKAMRTVARHAPDRELDMLDVCYAAIRGGLPHGDIREIRKMFKEDRARFDQLVMDVRDAEAGWEPGVGAAPLKGPELDEDLDEYAGEETEVDEDEEEEPPGPNMPEYEPAPEVRDRFATHLDAFRASQGPSVTRLLDEVLNRLEILASDTNNRLEEALAGDAGAIRNRLDRVADWVASHVER